MAEKELARSVPLTIVAKNLRYLGTNLTKDIRERYNKSYKR